MPTQVNQRRERLLKLLQADGFVSVERMSERLRVSPLTVRRDLDALQADGLAERVHGGARYLPAARAMDQSEISFYTRQGAQVIEKQAIARAAVQLLKADEILVVDASTSGRYFARTVPTSLPLTIITYSACLPVELVEHPSLQVISTGGVLHRRSLCYLGEEVGRTLATYHPRRAFFGAKGVALESGCTDALLPEIQLKAALAQQVEELVILADHTKLGNIGLAGFARIDQVHTLITDAEADPAIVQAIREHGVNVVLAPIPGDEDI